MDGSPGGFYFAPASSSANATKLVVHLEGGGECRTARACTTWAFHSGTSITWPQILDDPKLPGSPMDSSIQANPDFHDWAKLFLPYCSADLHSGTRTERSEPLGGWFFAGHNLLAGALAQLKRLHPSIGHSPSHVLVTGSSAGGIGALIHADWFRSSQQWPSAAIIKVSPEAGLFYPPVSSVRDSSKRIQTSDVAMGMLREWQPYLHTSCAAANTNHSVAICTNAHRLLPYITTPLFLRENLFDVAKLANCGLDVHVRGGANLQYLKEWGQQARQAMESRRRNKHDGFFAPSCLAHASNLRFSSAPMVGGSKLLDVMRSWYFGGDGSSSQYATDDCGDLPCTKDKSAGEACPLLASVHECHTRCRLNRRKRRIRLGLNPRSPGHNVCQVDMDVHGLPVDEEAPPSTSSSSSTTSSASPPLDEGEAVTRAVIATPSRDLEEDVAPDDPNLQESTSKQNKRRRARRARLQPRNRNRE